MQALSEDIRSRVVAFVAEGGSRREAARKFRISPASAVRFVAQWRRERSLKAKPQGGDRRRKLARWRDEIVAIVEGQPDITMPELSSLMSARHDLSAAPASLSRFLCRLGYTYKKNADGVGARTPRCPRGAHCLDQLSPALHGA